MATEKTSIEVLTSEMAEIGAWLKEHLPELERILEDTKRTQEEIARLREEDRVLLKQMQSRLW